MRQPNFDNLLKVLRRGEPDRPTLFELFLNQPLYERLAGRPYPPRRNSPEEVLFLADAFAAAGYDYATVHACEFGFPVEHAHKETISLNDGAGLTSRDAVERYPWPDPEACDYSKLRLAEASLPQGMRLLVMGPGGVLENVTALVGYDNLCLMLYDDEALLEDIFRAVGERMVRYYELAARCGAVGALISNDDWGFNTQPFLSPEQMRRFVYPWHKRIVQAIHAAGKPAILHSCGNFELLMDDVIDELRYDAKHSYEDSILPVEESYERWHERIAILGGIGMDFLIRASTEEIRCRCREMLARVAGRGGYALGTGNSVPEYVPQEHYFAMIETATRP